MLIVSALILWLLALFLAGWAIRRATEPEPAPPRPPDDPVKALVAKWMHDWERGRA